MKKNNQPKTISAKSAHKLLQELTKSGTFVKFSGNIEGNSMLPWIKAGDTVFITPITSRIKTGEIIAFFQGTNSRFVAHRVMKAFKNHIITKGDNCFKKDPPVPCEQIAGRVQEVKRGTCKVKYGLGKMKFFIALLSRFNILIIIYRFGAKIKKEFAQFLGMLVA